MPKLKILRNNLSPDEVRSRTYTFYVNKYYSLFMNRYVIDGVDYQANDYILKQFWANGTIAAFQIKETKGSDEWPEGLVVFVPYAPNGWNIYDYPTSINLINTKGVSFIPAESQIVDEDAVIGYCQRNKKSVKMMVEYYVDKIVNLEIVIDINLTAHKMPFMIGCDPDDSRKMKELFDLIQSDYPALFADLAEVDKFKALVSGAPYILDKLYDLKHALENELREYLGLDNLGNSEKKEHLITGEIQANNDVIASSEGCFFDSMSEFIDRVNETFGTDFSVKINKKEQPKPESKQEKEIQDNETIQ